MTADASGAADEGSSRSRTPYDLYIVGLGIVSVRQVTREAESAMKRSSEIFYASDAIGIEEYLRTLSDQVTEIYVSTLREGEDRLSKYNRIAAAVIEAALDHGPVAFAVAGHPMVFVYPTQQILAAAGDLGLRVKVIPGISSFDTMIVDLQLDPGTLGVQMYETTAMLLQQRPLQPDVPCFLWQIGSVETRMFTRSPSVPERFTRLQDYLQKFYPADHLVRIVYSASHPLASPSVLEFAIAEMHLHAAEIHPGATLYIPPAEVSEIQDKELELLVDSADHLRAITQPRAEVANAKPGPLSQPRSGETNS